MSKTTLKTITEPQEILQWQKKPLKKHRQDFMVSVVIVGTLPQQKRLTENPLIVQYVENHLFNDRMNVISRHSFIK